MDVVFCMPCQASRQCMALDNQVNQLSMPHCIGMMICYPAYQVFTTLLRCRVNEKFNLGESCCFSFIFGFYCPLCSLCQTHRQLTIRGVWPGGVCVQQPYFSGNAPIH